VGFLEHAQSLFLEKDRLRTKLLISPKSIFPRLIGDKNGFVNVLPEPKTRESEDGRKTISLMGYCFPYDAQGKMQLGVLFRAAVLHLGVHNVCFRFEDYQEWRKNKDPRLARFTISIIEDAKAYAYVLMHHPNKLRNEREVIIHLAQLLSQFKEKVFTSFRDGNMPLIDEELRVAQEIYCNVEDTGPIVETPFLPYTEELGKCSIFSPFYFVDSDVAIGNYFRQCLKYLGGSFSSFNNEEQAWKKMAEIEGNQVINSWEHRKERTEKMIAKYKKIIEHTKFKSVEVPQLNYTEFLRSKSRCKSEAHRLIESLLVARDAIDEDPRKMYGVLDLQEVVQVIASKSPRMDVFMLDENISKSYAWIILLDASRSMKHIMDFAVELFVMAAEAANQLLLDPTSWGMYAFNSHFLVIKDPKERYNIRVKSRIGGIEFEGSTYIPDALETAGKIIKTRNENLRLIMVITDGWPSGYNDINPALSKTMESLERANIAVLGIGAKSQQIGSCFKKNCAVYTLRDMKKKFSNVYLGASRIAVES